MNIFEKIEKINNLHRLIKNECTGNPLELAKRLGVSRSTLYNIIEELKLIEAPISYSRRRETFFYTKDFDLDINWSASLLDKNT